MVSVSHFGLKIKSFITKKTERGNTVEDKNRNKEQGQQVENSDKYGRY